jgi:hypothetical protein
MRKITAQRANLDATKKLLMPATTPGRLRRNRWPPSIGTRRSIGIPAAIVGIRIEGEFINALMAKRQFEIDEFLDARNLGRLDILYADIQGCELQMLDAARATLASTKIDYLFISTHSQKLHGDVVRTVGDYGYRVEVSSDFDNDTTSFDGFVFASSPGATRIFREFVPFGRTKIAAGSVDRVVEAFLAIRDAAA